MKNAIIIHGMPGKDEYYSDKYPSASNFHWFPWLQKQLIIRDIKADTPEMPHAYNPQYDIWKREFERFDITNETILVGHSCGGGFLIRWLSEHPEVKVGKVVLVAPWLDIDREDTTDFFGFEIDSDLSSRTNGVIIFHSDNDEKSINDSVIKITAEVPGVNLRIFPGRGHFVDLSLTPSFPELLEEILK
jgi:predicted alpha/beta hydrolase family esterase